MRKEEQKPDKKEIPARTEEQKPPKILAPWEKKPEKKEIPARKEEQKPEKHTVQKEADEKEIAAPKIPSLEETMRLEQGTEFRDGVQKITDVIKGLCETTLNLVKQFRAIKNAIIS